MFIKVLMLVLFFGLMVGVGVYCRSHATDVNGFVLGGRSVGPWLTAFAYGTSYFSAVIFVGYAGQFGWKYGLAASWIGLGNAFIGSLLAWAVLGRRTRIMTQQLDSRTMPEFFGRRFDSRGVKIGASAIIFIFLIPYTASLYNGLSRLFSMAFSIDYTWCVVVMAFLTAVYVIAGGYMATAINDFIQGLIMIVGIAAIILAVLNVNGGLVGSMAELSKMSAETPAGTMHGAFTSFLGPDPGMLLGVVILTSLGTWGLPQMVGKFYAIKDEDAVRKGTIISTLFAIIVAGGCYFLGGFGRLFLAESDFSGVYDAIVPKMLEVSLSPALIAVVLILVLSASMSTLSSLVLSSSSTITLDLINEAKKKKLGEKEKLNVLRCFVAVFIILSAAIAILQYKSSIAFIAQMMGVSWGTLAGCFLAPFMYGLYWKKTTRGSVWAAFVWGLAVNLFELLVWTGNVKVSGSFMGYFFASPINAGVLAMLGGMIVVPVVSMFTPKMDAKLVDNAFACYEKPTTVAQRENLG